MLSKKGLRERPSYDSLMQNIRTDFPLHLPNRDASFLRNSIQMTQFDGIGLLDNLDQQEERLVESKLRESVLKDVASGTGKDYKVMQTDPYTNTMVDKFTQAITNKSEGGSQTNRTFSYDSGTSTDKKPPGNDAGTSTDRKPPGNDAGTNPRFGRGTVSTATDNIPKSDSGSGPGPGAPGTGGSGTQHFNISDNPVPMEANEDKVKTEIKKQEDMKEEKKEQIKKEVKRFFEKRTTTTAEVIKKNEEKLMKKEDKMDVKPIPIEDSEMRTSVKRPKPEETKEETKVKKEELKEEKVKKEELKEEKKVKKEELKEEKKVKKEELKEEKKVKQEEKKEEKKEAKKKEDDPESNHESKGPRGRPRSVQPATGSKDRSKSQPRSKSDKDSAELTGDKINTQTGMLFWRRQSANDIRNQLALRKIPREMMGKTKPELLKQVERLIENHKW